MEYKYTFTVFTPTYNRAHLIHRVFESLKSQTLMDFEWLIVDDGSKDNTKEVVEEFKKSNFPIRYIYQENGGKHRAFNKGVKEAKGKFFLTADSDDRFLPDALEKLKYYWDLIPDNEKENFSAVTGLCIDKNGNIIGDKYPKDIFDSNSFETTFIFKIKGKKWGFQRTDVLKRFPFKEFEGENFIPKSSVWFEVSKFYITRYINEPLRIYEINEDSLSSNAIQLMINNPNGTIYNYYKEFNLPIPLKYKIKFMINCLRFSFYNKELFFGCIKIQNKLLLPFIFPVAFLMYIKDNLKK
ncbi:glycosyltransferase family 2 protein [Nitrosophilus alvini]|uniref:glycosyltransferase family 2 protein n=1 Tax=Nitrosophilus alvini TaxID=2714855 RepID=UPI001909AAF6|nr:glycosyltransferase family 2 protein [Nitrosophilus alvini]